MNICPFVCYQKRNSGEIQTIETKDIHVANGASANIDSYANRKFEALKKYGSRHTDLHWGFVRAIGTQLYLSNTVWSEDMMDRTIWKPIEEMI